MEANEVERRRWNDEQWATVWPKRERLTDAVTAFVLDAAALRPGERVLDVGCGGGKTSLAAARLVGPGGAVVGADLSTPLTALAERRAADADAQNVSFRVVDMQVETLEGAPFDIALSQFGVMFFDEPAAAFANIRAHLRPGGRIVFACWQAIERNPWFFAPAIANLLPPPPEPLPGKSPTGPFSLADPGRTAETAVLVDKEFENSDAETKTEPEGAFVQAWASQIGNIELMVVAILGAVFFTILLVAGNTMSQAVRERTGELGVLKAIVFTNAQGVAPGTPIRRSGVRIGEVRSVALDNFSGEVNVGISIEDQYILRKGDRPTLLQGILGGDASIAFDHCATTSLTSRMGKPMSSSVCSEPLMMFV